MRRRDLPAYAGGVSERRPWWPTPWWELHTARRLLPLLAADMGFPIVPLVLATDASAPSGCAACPAGAYAIAASALPLAEIEAVADRRELRRSGFQDSGPQPRIVGAGGLIDVLDQTEVPECWFGQARQWLLTRARRFRLSIHINERGDEGGHHGARGVLPRRPPGAHHNPGPLRFPSAVRDLDAGAEQRLWPQPGGAALLCPGGGLLRALPPALAVY